VTYTLGMESLTPSRVASPPRTISPLFQIQAMLGGTGAQIGWLLLGFGSIFFWVFASNADLSGWRFRGDTLARTSGVALECRQTGFSEGDESQSQAIYRNLYRYAVEGQPFQGVAYAVDRCVPGGPVAVEYLRLDPGVSRIEGMRRRPLSPWATLVAVVPAVGLCLVIGGLVKGRWNLRLVRHGLPAAGRLVEKVATRSSTMDHPDYRMAFEYTAQNGFAGRATVRTNQPERLEVGPETLVLCDPADLSNALVFRSLPGDVVMDREGQPARRGPLGFLFWPAVTILGNGWYVCRHWIA